MPENAQPAQLATLQTTLATTPTILAALQAVPTPPLTNLAALISGDSGDNTISGGSGDDPMEGLGGDDRLSGGQGDDLIAGDNIAFGPGVAGTINTTTAIGTTAGNDFVLGGAGNDSLAGDALAFNDNSLTEAAVTSTSTGGSASCDTVTGGTGNDVLSGDVMAISGTQATAYVMNSAEGAGAFAGDDSLRGYNNTDLAAGDALAIAVDSAFASVDNHADAGGSAGDDTVGGDGSADAVAGDAMAIGTDGYASVIVDNEAVSAGTAGNDVIDGQGDKNLMAGDGLAIAATGGEVHVDNTAGGTGAAGNDVLTSGDNSDTIAGDALIQGGGFAYVTNEVTADSLATAGCDTIDSGSNNDLISGDALAQDGGTASVTNNNGGFDLTNGRAGADLLLAGAGDDKVAGDALSQGGLAEVVNGGDDTLYGGDGADILSGDALGLGGGTTSVIGGGNDLIYGGSGDDIVYGDANGAEQFGGYDSLFGDEGNDVLYGNSGDDSLTGGGGDDTLYGGDGDDTAVFSGDSSQYQVTDLGNGAVQVTDLRAGSPDGTDILYDVETIEFSNGTFTPPAPVVEIDHLLKVLGDGSVAGDLDTVTTSVSLVSGVANGSLTLNADGTYSYVPDAGFSGLDSFSYLDGGVERTVRIEVGTAGTGPASQVNNQAGQRESQGDIAMLADGGYVVTWVNTLFNLQRGIYAQRFDADGNEVGSEIQILKTGGSSSSGPSSPTVTGLEDGGFVLAWQIGVQAIQTQRYDAAGNPVGSQGALDVHRLADDITPEMTALDGGGYVVVWRVIGSNSSRSNLRVQALDDDGTPRGDVATLDLGDHNGIQDVLALPGGGFIVIFMGDDYRTCAAQRFDATGQPLGDLMTLYDLPVGVSVSQLSSAMLESGDFVVTWAMSGQDGDGYGIVAQVFDVAGNPVTPLQVVNQLTDGAQNAPSVSHLPGGGFVVAWTSSEGDGEGSGIFAQKFDGNGSPVGHQFLVTGTAAGDQYNVEVTTLADGRLAFSWSQPDDRYDGIFTRVLSLGGDLHDNLQGDEQNDELIGFGGSDLLTGNGGNDLFLGGAGDDTIDGGNGLDIARFSGALSDYQITNLGGGSFEVMDLRTGSPDGTDVVINVESLQFADRMLELRPDSRPTTLAGDHLLKLATGGSAAGDLYAASPSVSLVSDVANGSLTLNADGTYSYTANPGFTGVDSFTYLDGGIEHSVRIEVGLTGNGAAHQVNNLTGQAESQGDIAALADGGYVVTWVNTLFNLQRGVYAQRFDAEGNEVGSEIVILKTGGASNSGPSAPTVAALESGGFVLAWQISDSAIQLRHYDAAGNQVGSESSLDIAGGLADDLTPEIVALQYGGYAVAWRVVGSSLYESSLRVQAFDDDGTPRSPMMTLEIDGQNGIQDIIALSGGGYLVSWMGNDYRDAVAQRFTSLGEPVGDQIVLYDLPAGVSVSHMSTALLEGGDFVVTWAMSGQDGDGYGIVAQVFDIDGNAVTSPQVVNQGSAGNQNAPSVTHLPGGGFVVAWTSTEGDGDGSGVFARLFDGAGNAVGDQFMVSDSAIGHQYDIEVTTLSDGRIALTWASPDDTYSGIYTRILSLGGDAHDNIQGDGDNNYLLGFGGNDVLVGNGGDDVFVGGAGADTLQGGSGADVFIYDDIVDAGDLIDGFDATGVDSIDIDGLLDSLGIADVDRSSRVEVQQAGTGQDAVISVDTTGDAVFDTVVATVTNVTGDLDQADLNLGTLV